MHASVLIIGAGVAGLSAAARLRQNGWNNVKILEARSFVGGRTFTYPYGSSGLEFGAQWIHGQTANAIYQLAKKNDLVDDDAPNFLSSIYNFPQLKTDEERTAASDVCQFFRDLLDHCSDGNIPISTPSKCLGDFLQESFLNYVQKCNNSLEIQKIQSAVFDWNVRFELHYNGCQTLNDLSVQLLQNYLSCDGNPVTELKNNYVSFVNILRDSIPREWVLLNCVVKKIKCNSDDSKPAVEILTDDEKVFEADHVIVTIPLGHLKDNLEMFDPVLPVTKQEAIRRMGFGTVNKIFFHFENPFWEVGDVFNVLWLDERKNERYSISENNAAWLPQCPGLEKGDSWAQSIFYFTYVRNQPHVLCAWLSGDGARKMEDVPLEDVERVGHSVLKMVLADPLLPKPSRTMRSSWYNDPLFRGSYSYLSVGCEKYNLLPKDIAEPILAPRKYSQVYPFLLFGGEATHPNYYSTAHGAYETGVREADRITQFYKEPRDSEIEVPDETSTRGPKIVIVGGGVAGLAAAQKLASDYGYRDVVVLEAQESIGGRIRTVPYDQGVLELGAQWVHGEDGNPLFNYAQERDLLSDPKLDYSVEGTGHFVDSTGHYLDKGIVDEVIMTLDSIKEDLFYNRSNTESVGTFFRKRFNKYLASCRDSTYDTNLKLGLYDWYIRFEVIDNSCETLDCLSIDGFCEWTDCPGVPLINFKSGFSSLVESLTKDLPKRCIRTSCPVECIEWRRPEANRPALVHCKDGVIFPADHVIVTSSIGFLKENLERFFFPKLPASKKCTLDSFGFGTVNKIYLVFKEPFWNEGDLGFQLIWNDGHPGLNCLAKEHPWIRDISGFDTVRGQKGALVGWIGGPGAMAVEQIPDTVVVSVCTKLFRIFTGRNVSLPSQMIRSKWHENVYIRGAYSNRLSGYKQLETNLLSSPLYTQHEKKSSQPWPVVLFAGEATDRQYFSTVHGALRSGWREAERIACFLSSKCANQHSPINVQPRL